MKLQHIFRSGILFCILAFVVITVGKTIRAENDNTLVELMPAVDIYAWYEQETGFTPDLETFGIFNVQPVGDSLYFGLGTGAPSELDGALLAQSDGTAITNLGQLDEQGADELILFNGEIHVAGSDPCCPDSHDAGNHYVYRPKTGLTKYRDPINGLPNALHTFGFEIVDDYLYAATSGFVDPTRYGRIFRTQDGITWDHVSYLGDWRAYDILEQDGQFYATFIDEYLGVEVNLASSSDAIMWTTVVSDTLQPVALREFNGRVLTLARDRESIIAVSADGSTTTHPVPHPLGLAWKYSINRNIWTVVGPYLYTIAELENGNAVIMRSADLVNWETVLESSEPLITLIPWPEKNQLIVTSRERNAAIYTLDLPTTQQTYLPMIFR